MLNRLVKENLRSKFAIVSIVAAFLAGTGMAAAQVVDDPPGSAFQDQGFANRLAKRLLPQCGPVPLREHALPARMPTRRGA